MDQSEIDKLNANAWISRINDSLASCKLSESALNFAEKTKYQKGIADAQRTKGFCLIRFAKHKDAFSSLGKAKEIYKVLDDQKGLASIHEYLGIIYRTWGDFQSSLENINQAIVLSQQTQFIENEMTNHYQLGVTYRAIGEYDQALESLYKSLSIANQLKHDLMKGYVVNVIGSIYFRTENYVKALENYQQGLDLRQLSGDKWAIAGSLDNIGMTYLRMGNLESAMDHCNQSIAINKKVGDKKGEANSLMLLAQIQGQMKDCSSAIKFAEACRTIRSELGDQKGEAEILIQLARLRRQAKNEEEVVTELLAKALNIVQKIHAKDLKSEVYKEFYLLNKSNKNYEKSIDYLEQFLENEKSLHKDSVEHKVKNMEIARKVEESKKEAEIFKLRNVELSRMYKKSEAQKKKITTTLEQLKTTQSQLIQSAKMASLGELTAGIAHEIQNPLNFVNNFSDVSGEMIDEAVEELSNNDIDEVKDILTDLKSNLDKISHHGNRASSIVKGMLEHSRTDTGEKVLTDINALCDEYLRLAYHGLRAKNESFSAAYETHFDNDLPKIKVIPQELGRVLLNIINNAFYACSEQSERTSANRSVSNSSYKSSTSADQDYQPLVSITTKQLNNSATITVKDNGSGIPDAIKDKIFQPFFTTKATGQGTGLGLSLAYDIVKAHGGELSVESKEGEGATFIIELPVM